MSCKEKEYEIQNSLCSLCVNRNFDGADILMYAGTDIAMRADTDAAVKPHKGQRGCCHELAASITVEATLVFPIVLVIMILIVEMSFKIHDAAVGNALSIYHHNKLNECIYSCYDAELRAINVEMLATRPLIGYDKNFCEAQDDKLRFLITEYFKKIRIYDDAKIDFIDPDYNLKNSMMVRWSHILIDRGGLFTND